jgi:hypothetical protein
MLSPFHCRRIVSKWTEDNRGIHALLAADHQKSRSGICLILVKANPPIGPERTDPSSGT